MKQIIVVVSTLFVSIAFARADETVQEEMKQDVVLRALVDELERGRVGLELEDLKRPYFIEYALADTSRASVHAGLGAVISKNVNRSRRLRSVVRVGSYKLDNTNFEDRSGWWFRGRSGFFGGGAAIPIEDDYNAIRQAIWWGTDRKYKDAIEALAKKEAFMETKVIEDKPDDFSHEKAAVFFEDRADVSVSADRLEAMALTISQIFREYPDIKTSSVSIEGRAGNRYLVNTEGTRLRGAGTYYSVSINAAVQASDGMELADSMSVHGHELEQLPAVSDLSERCRDMIQKLIALKDAPKLEAYTGPVLFEPEAAATIFSKHFAKKFTGGQRAVGSRTRPDDFANKLNKRI
ncbi:MAG: hypothetical protein ACYTFA_03300, partial [Planctomycetota bacterium]